MDLRLQANPKEPKTFWKLSNSWTRTSNQLTKSCVPYNCVCMLAPNTSTLSQIFTHHSYIANFHLHWKEWLIDYSYMVAVFVICGIWFLRLIDWLHQLLHSCACGQAFRIILRVTKWDVGYGLGMRLNCNWGKPTRIESTLEVFVSAPECRDIETGTQLQKIKMCRVLHRSWIPQNSYWTSADQQHIVSVVYTMLQNLASCSL